MNAGKGLEGLVAVSSLPHSWEDSPGLKHGKVADSLKNSGESPSWNGACIPIGTMTVFALLPLAITISIFAATLRIGRVSESSTQS